MKSLLDEHIDHAEKEGWDYTSIYLEPQDVEIAKARDSEKDVGEALEEISRSHSWSWLGEEGKRIQKVLAGVDEEDEMEVLRAWERYMREHLTSPFDAEVAEFQERGPLKSGDAVRVKEITLIDDNYGVIVELGLDRKGYAFPLCDLEVIDKTSPNYQAVKDYRVWFANR